MLRESLLGPAELYLGDGYFLQDGSVIVQLICLEPVDFEVPEDHRDQV